MKKLFAILLALTMLLSLAAGCGAGGEVDLSQMDSGVELRENVDLGALLDEGVPMADGPALSATIKPLAMGTLVEKNGSAAIDNSDTAEGYVMAAWLAGGEPKLKVLVKGPSGTTYQYNLKPTGEYETFPLSDGSGSYTVGVYKNTSGTSYATILSKSISVTLNDEFAPFLHPNQYVNYSEDSAAVAKAAELCDGLEDNLEKVGAVYDFVVNNTTYDKSKAKSVKTGYLPDVDETLATGKGICFDYAALMASMLRSQGVPTKLIVGYTGDAYHAWINVYSETEGWMDAVIYFNGNEWKLMDPTFASSGKQSESIMKYIGDGQNYSAKYQY